MKSPLLLMVSHGAANRREKARLAPRIPFPPDFHAFAAPGSRLIDLHIDYEKQAESPSKPSKSSPPYPTLNLGT